jgi:hypothetical protein
MGGIYGDFLEYFPELFQWLDCWELNASEQRINIRRIRAIIIDDMGTSIVRKRIIDEWVKDLKGCELMLTIASAVADINTYFIHPEKQDVYKITSRLTHSREGGFKVWKVDKIQGQDSIRTDELEVKAGVF